MDQCSGTRPTCRFTTTCTSGCSRPTRSACSPRGTRPSRAREAVGMMTIAGQAADAVWFLNDVARIHLSGLVVGGRVSIVDFISPPGDMPPLHRHQREDELFYVVSGRLALHQPGRRVEAEAGAAL